MIVVRQLHPQLSQILLPLLHNTFCANLFFVKLNHAFCFKFFSIFVKLFLGSGSHAWNVAPVTFTWQCLHNDTAYSVTHILVLPEATIQLNLIDDTAAHLPYRNAEWTELALYL